MYITNHGNDVDQDDHGPSRGNVAMASSSTGVIFHPTQNRTTRQVVFNPWIRSSSSWVAPAPSIHCAGRSPAGRRLPGACGVQ